MNRFSCRPELQYLIDLHLEMFNAEILPIINNELKVTPEEYDLYTSWCVQDSYNGIKFVKDV